MQICLPLSKINSVIFYQVERSKHCEMLIFIYLHVLTCFTQDFFIGYFIYTQLLHICFIIFIFH